MKTEDVIKLIINIGLILLLGNVILFAGYYLNMNYNHPGEPKLFNLFGEDTKELINVSGDATQFMPGLRFSESRISYFINSDCAGKKASDFEKALEIIENRTEKISFYVTNEQDAEILVGCSKDSYKTETNKFVAGEGGPTSIISYTKYPIILKGKVILYEETSCAIPVTELHELLHVLGFNHINKSETILYPYVSCNQKLDLDMIQILKEVYSVKSLPDLYFSNVTITRKEGYADMTIRIDNRGLKDSNIFEFNVYSNSEQISTKEIEGLRFGTGVIYSYEARLPSAGENVIKLEIIANELELDKNNNIVEMKI